VSAIIEVLREEDIGKIEEFQEGKGDLAWRIIAKAGNYASIMSNKKSYGGNKKGGTIADLEKDLSEYLAKAFGTKPEDEKSKIVLSYLYTPRHPDILLSKFVR
jgi:hypothetical protein